MKSRKQWLVLGFILLTGCNRLSTPIISAVPSPPASFSPIATPTHEEIATATPVPTATPVTPPSPAETAVTFLKAWEKGNYTRMYALLTASSQATFSLKDFMKHQQNLAEVATVRSMETEMLSMLQNGLTAQVASTIAGVSGMNSAQAM